MRVWFFILHPSSFYFKLFTRKFEQVPIWVFDRAEIADDRVGILRFIDKDSCLTRSICYLINIGSRTDVKTEVIHRATRSFLFILDQDNDQP